MKYQSQHNVIDPEAPVRPASFTFKPDDDSEIQGDAFVIGEDGDLIEETEIQAALGIGAGPSRWAKPAAFVLCALFVVLTAWNVSRSLQGYPVPPKPSPFQSKQALYLGVMKIDAYRRVNGVVPDSLAEAGLPEADVYAYQRVNPTRYVLSFGSGGSKLEYDSSEPKEKFFGSPKDMLTMGDSK